MCDRRVSPWRTVRDTHLMCCGIKVFFDVPYICESPRNAINETIVCVWCSSMQTWWRFSENVCFLPRRAWLLVQRQKPKAKLWRKIWYGGSTYNKHSSRVCLDLNSRATCFCKNMYILVHSTIYSYTNVFAASASVVVSGDSPSPCSSLKCTIYGGWFM